MFLDLDASRYWGWMLDKIWDTGHLTWDIGYVDIDWDIQYLSISVDLGSGISHLNFPWGNPKDGLNHQLQPPKATASNKTICRIPDTHDCWFFLCFGTCRWSTSDYLWSWSLLPRFQTMFAPQSLQDLAADSNESGVFMEWIHRKMPKKYSHLYKQLNRCIFFASPTNMFQAFWGLATNPTLDTPPTPWRSWVLRRDSWNSRP